MGSYLTQDEIHQLECAADNELEQQQQKQQANSNFKIPIFQPTAAAAMMYNMQNLTLKQHNKQNNENSMYMRSKSITNTLPLSNSSNVVDKKLDDNTQNAQFNKSSLSPVSDGTVSPSVIAKILKKEADTKQKLFPYICHKCKKDVWTCDTSSQTINVNEIETANKSDKIIYPSSGHPTSPSFMTHNRSKSYATNFSENKNESILNVFDVNECQKVTNSTGRKHLDSWTDMDFNYK